MARVSDISDLFIEAQFAGMDVVSSEARFANFPDFYGKLITLEVIQKNTKKQFSVVKSSTRKLSEFENDWDNEISAAKQLGSYVKDVTDDIQMYFSDSASPSSFLSIFSQFSSDNFIVDTCKLECLRTDKEVKLQYDFFLKGVGVVDFLFNWGSKVDLLALTCYFQLEANNMYYQNIKGNVLDPISSTQALLPVLEID